MGPLAAALDYRKALIYPRKAQDAHYVGARIEQYQLPVAGICAEVVIEAYRGEEK